jgi:hypothetical protein
MLFAAAPQSEGIPSHSEAPIGDVRMGQHAGIEDDTRYRAAEQAMASAQQPTQMMASGGYIPRYNGEFDSVVGISPEFGGEPPEPYSAPPDQASVRKVASPAFQNPFVTQAPRNAEDAAMLQRYPVPAKAGSAKARPDFIQTEGAGDVPSYAAPSMDIPGMFRSAMTAAQGMDNPFAKDIEAMGKERVKAAQQDVAGLEAIHARFDDIFKGRKERMGTREQEVGKLEDEAGRMALINFGLAMAQTPGKGLSGLLGGLTAGAKAGSAEYAKGMDKFRAAQEKLNDAKDRLEDLEVNRAELNARELHKGRMAVRATMVDVQKDMINANMEMYKLNRADSKDLVKAQMELGLEQLRQSGANARATMPTGENRTFMMLGEGKTDKERFTSGLTKYKELMGDKQGARAYEKFLENNINREKAGLKEYTPEQFRRQQASFYGAPTVVDVANPARP